MFSNLVKSRGFLLVAVILPLVAMGFITLRTLPAPSSLFASSPSAGLSGRTEGIGDMQDSLARERKLLATLEQEQSRLRREVIHLRKLHQAGEISKNQVLEAEQLFVTTLKRLHERRHSAMEAEIAITEAVLGEKVDRLPALPVNGYSETSDLARFNGSFRWSLKEASRLDTYFSRAFGRRLPITALGQSETHNRLRLDHRDSLDVALHPDSVEGKALIEHLRKTQIPFLAFRGASPGASTGPHIHIGRPSRRYTS